MDPVKLLRGTPGDSWSPVKKPCLSVLSFWRACVSLEYKSAAWKKYQTLSVEWNVISQLQHGITGARGANVQWRAARDQLRGKDNAVTGHEIATESLPSRNHVTQLNARQVGYKGLHYGMPRTTGNILIQRTTQGLYTQSKQGYFRDLIKRNDDQMRILFLYL